MVRATGSSVLGCAPAAAVMQPSPPSTEIREAAPLSIRRPAAEALIDGEAGASENRPGMRRGCLLVGRMVAAAGSWVFVAGCVLLILSLPSGGISFSRPIFEVALIPLLVGLASIFIPPSVWWLSAMTPARKQRRATNGYTGVAGILERSQARLQRGSHGRAARDEIAERDQGCQRGGEPTSAVISPRS